MPIQYEQLAGTPESLTRPGTLIAGKFPRGEKAITIVQGQAAMTRGAVLGKVALSGKYAAYDPDAEDGTEDPAGILGEDVVAASTGDIPCFMYVTGDFNVAMCLDINGDALGAAAVAQLEALNIYLKTVA